MAFGAWRGRDGRRLAPLDGAVSVGQPFRREPLSAIIDRQRAIQVRVDVYAGAGVAAAARTGKQLEDASIELDGVVVLDGPRVLEAADAIEVRARRGGAPGWRGVGGGFGKAGIVAGEKPGEDPLGLVAGAGLGEAQFDHEAILQGAEEALDAPFSLRGLGGDPADTQFPEGAADLGFAWGATQLLLQGEWAAGVRAKDALAIGVDGAGEPIAVGEVAEEEEVAVGLLGEPEDAPEHLPRRIVDGAVEHQARAAVLEPGMVTAVHLDEEARLRHALASAAMPRGAPFAGTADAGGAEEPLHGLARYVEALPLGQQLREVMIVHAGVGGAGQGEDPGPDRPRGPSWGRPSAIPMGEGARAVLPQAGEQPAEVAQREARQSSRLPGAQSAVVDAGQNVHALMFPLGQGNRLPVHPSRVTDSLTR